MEITYNIASANGSIEVTRTDIHADGRNYITKAVRYADGSCKCFKKTAKGTWANYSRGAMAVKRFGWDLKFANEYLAN